MNIFPMIVLSLAANAALAQTPVDDAPCAGSLRVRDTLGASRASNDPMTLSLTRAAGGDTVGRVDAALLYDGACDTGTDSEWQFGGGVDYHYDSNPDARRKLANVGGDARYYFGATEGTLIHRLSFDARAGRNFVADANTLALGLEYGSWRTNRQRDDTSGGNPPFWLFGGDHARAVGGASVLVFRHQVVPRIEYFRGYRSNAGDTLAAAWSTLHVRADWFPLAGLRAGEASDLRVFARWDGRRRIGGDDALPKSANNGTAGIAWGFASGDDPEVSRTVGLSLQYEVGRSPASGFRRDETVSLVLTYLFDRANAF